ncbi:RidA family protein [Culicoidibacter larvae]|uniref:RidA family protein n=1 Tax=Culicoidibacter larvae TaxID=2579976 RepID=A0A5R8QD20_9FIRM|nr:RidA family protein [Culicoidibacter larvae]TLG74180.1 RidA family protein [Culicoidibacter larvae]
MKQSRNPQTVHPPLAHYVHQIEINQPTKILMLSGQVGMTLEKEIPTEASAQLEQALLNIKANLDAANLDVADITKVTIYVTEPIDASIRSTILNDFFGSHTPCMTYLQIQALANPALKVEIDTVVYK